VRVCSDNNRDPPNAMPLFVQRAVSLSEVEWTRLRAMSLAQTEFGGHFVAVAGKKGKCHLRAEVALIQGTALKKMRGKVAQNYTDGAESEVLIASLPFTAKNVARAQRSCRVNERGTFFWHSHPLHIALQSPPSMGDFAAHCVLGNLRNYAENKLVGSMFIVAYEGIYEYGITEERFKKELAYVKKVEARYPSAGYDVHLTVASTLRDRVFDSLRDANQAFYKELARLIPNTYASDVPTVTKEKWLCATVRDCSVKDDFPMRKHMEKDTTFVDRLTRFHDTNTYAMKLAEIGFYYRYVPYPHAGGDMTLHVNVT
jgi:hypothetical protein